MSVDGRTANLLARTLGVVERLGGELVLTKTDRRWTAQAVIGADTVPAATRAVAFGHGTLFEALHDLACELGIRGIEDRPRAGTPAVPVQRRPVGSPFTAIPEATLKVNGVPVLGT